jgi:hypothetical protein
MIDLLAPALVKQWRRRRRDAVMLELGSRYNVPVERIVVREVSGRLVVAIRPQQLELPLPR